MSKVEIRWGIDPGAFALLDEANFKRPWREDAFSSAADRFGVGLWLDGACICFVYVSKVADEAEILRIATDPNQKRKGYARRLLEALFAHLLADGVGQLFLEVSAQNQPALAFYAAMGFEETGRRKNYYGPNDDAVLMALGL